MKRILVVEPDIETGKLLTHSIETNGYMANHAMTAQSAIHEADVQSPDLLITELLIADQNGLALLHELRSHQDWSEIPVIIHTHVPPTDASIASTSWRELGVVDYLYKPTTSLSKLHNRIQMVLN